jgi:hypothetical protein
MNISMAQFIKDVRRLVQDQEAQRFEDIDILDALRIGMSEVARLRPDVLGGCAKNVIDPTTATTFTLDLAYYSPLVSFVSGWLLLGSHIDGEEASIDSVASGLLGRFSQQLLGAA